MKRIERNRRMDITLEEERSMADQELSEIYTSDEEKSIKDNELLTLFTETYYKRDFDICTTDARNKVRDYLHSEDFSRGKRCGQPIADCVRNLYPHPSASTLTRLRIQAGTSRSTSTRVQTDSWIPPPAISSSEAVRDMVKSPEHTNDQYDGIYDSLLLPTTKEVFSVTVML